MLSRVFQEIIDTLAPLHGPLFPGFPRGVCRTFRRCGVGMGKAICKRVTSGSRCVYGASDSGIFSFVSGCVTAPSSPPKSRHHSARVLPPG